MVDYAVYLLYRIGTGLFGLLPLPLAFAIGQMGGVIAWLVLPQYRKLALRNVRIAFAGELSEKEMRRIVRRHFQHLGANLLCSVKFPRMPMEKILQRVRIEHFRARRKLFPEKAAGRDVFKPHRFVGVLHSVIPPFPARSPQQHDLSTYPQSAYRSSCSRSTQPIWS
jgi:Lauroyl/myristoyl acyltransferase